MITIVAAVVAVLASILMFGFGKKRFDPAGQFCYIPGGSAGLGKSLAAELVRRGAHVVIVARGAQRAGETVAELKTLAKPDQKILFVTADLSDQVSSARALDEAAASFDGRAPDHVFLCAGMSRPMLFIDTTTEDLKANFDGVYWVSAWTAHAVVQMMVKQKVQGTLTFVSSFLGYTTFAGYSTYTPAKFALRGLADTLRNELLLFGIKVHLYMPAGMLSPGYEEENKTKPKVTQKIEEGDNPISCEAAAAILVKGLERGNYQITNDFVTDLVRVSAKGAVPSNGPLDVVYSIISAIGLPVWRMMTDSQVRASSKQVDADLQARGFYA
ncbi:hypothetical protein CcaverHIS002_0501340 [Cutaneotrichosporon cavernicola]|uniref:3-dehydrosphinganine reductase n=1 Tax=Cutaneotrichosporon cavernicola TaxID=279322 RepID=A0AA48QXR9_9TREE|nr:uncharacterized protein CcaverHIS019_0601350 [Cutaneotrichosporon cavernicola]BEI84733.1 hypothetical protein CcaverHIS002_0501340 [Cutaneotrichosporon cavernicola]BEI93676.1 hypothetical protein CcaverHIS019_0601350 [Cutaneotrichosporon cavernicola]BEJ01453.1 hypothetical protein CcaverHIS631_0601350 [Cutaneotrichosporon cavernicola]BEJ09220.1 hypothetical protein CcaverHIS641_0601350 [Cutaneotrichosporon cavernicola]